MRYIPTEAERILAASAAGTSGEKRYRLSAGDKSITCLGCNRESFHPDDVRHRYCAFCNIFHAY